MKDPLFAIGNHGTRHVPLSVTGRAMYGLKDTAGAISRNARRGSDCPHPDVVRD